MNNEENNENPLAKIVIKLSNIIIVLVVFVIALLILLAIYLPKSKPAMQVETPMPDEFGNFTEAAKQNAKLIKVNSIYWHAPDESELKDNPKKDEILYGKELIAHTADYFGPKGKVFIGSINGMNCQNCHLEAGTKVFGNNYSAVSSTYPKYRARSGSLENIYKRVNDCFERSLNGTALDTNSKEMNAIVSYIYWLGKDVVKGKKPEGSGFKDITFLDRAADSKNGKEVYVAKCQSCHKENGLGILNSDESAYTYPPLWGANSYNDGAGLYRLSNFAKFVKYNMPLGVTHNNTQLSDEEAWDVAAFVNSLPRPKKDLKNDWPKIEEKPFDHPFGPYKDGFTEEEHKYGSFKPIIEKSEMLKKK